MTGLVRKAALMAALGLLVSAAAMASVPSPCNSTLPCGIQVIGSSAGAADPNGAFSITVRDLANNPVANSSVVLDFSACCNDVRLSSTQLDPGLTLVGKTVRAIANGSGVASFKVMGAATPSDPTPAAGCVKVYADGVLLTEGSCQPSALQCAVYDLNGAGGGPGVGAADLSRWLADFFSSPAPYRARSDYDYAVLCSKAIGAADLSKWLALFFAAGSTGNGPAFVACP